MIKASIQKANANTNVALVRNVRDEVKKNNKNNFSFLDCKCHNLSPKELIVTLDWFLAWHRVSRIQLDEHPKNFYSVYKF